jgi:glycolate oxidase iron-sulfur subunit
MKPQTLIDYTRSLDCIHCGLCIQICPTYQLTAAEPSSPRGRIHLMRSVAEGDIEPDASFAEEMDFCLLCRHCESVCPSGVEFGAMMEHTRDGLAPKTRIGRLAKRLGFQLLTSRTQLRLASATLRLLQQTGLARLLAALLGKHGAALAKLPPVPPASRRRPLPEHTPATTTESTPVALLEGCVMPHLLGDVNRATLRVLAASGHTVQVPKQQPTCCGSLHAHNGELDQARAIAKQTIAAFEETPDLPIVTNSAGCGSHMKEYANLFAEDATWRTRAERFSARVRDLSEVLEPRALRPIAAAQIRTPITYDDPCHLCHGQGIRSEPRALLDATGLEQVELEDSESCCGSAGIYSALRPSDAAAILQPKLESLRASGAKTLVTANPGCQLQWQSGIEAASLDVEVLHLAELLERTLGGGDEST